MALAKKNLKAGTQCKVTFSLPAEAVGDVKEVRLAGDFNGWDIAAEAYKLKKNKDGDYFITLDLEKGKEYQFRYLLDGTRWENDWAADKYIPVPHMGEENSVVIV